MTSQPKDQPVDELRDKIAKIMYRDGGTGREVDSMFLLCQAECNRARLAENRYTEKYWRVDFPDDGDMTTFLDNRRKELQQLMKESES